MRTDPDLVAQVAATTGLAVADAGRVIDDVLSFHAETLEHLVHRRHRELRLAGLHNTEAFVRIAEELGECVVAAPRRTERQLRRMVYG